jgi:hypothetical protein
VILARRFVAEICCTMSFNDNIFHDKKKLIIHLCLGFPSGNEVLYIGIQEVKIGWEVKGEIKGYMGCGPTSTREAHPLMPKTLLSHGRRMRSWQWRTLRFGRGQNSGLGSLGRRLSSNMKSLCSLRTCLWSMHLSGH